MAGLDGESIYDDRKQEQGRKNQFHVFLVFVVISTVVWLLIKLSHDYNYVRAYRIVYSGSPSGKIISGNPDSVLFLSLKSNGYNLLYRKIFPREEKIQIDLSNLKTRKNGNTWEASLMTDDLTDRVNSQISKHVKLIGITPKILYFRLDRSCSVKVPVKPAFQVSYGQQFGLYGKYCFDPDSVTVTGPCEVIRNIKEAVTTQLSFDNLEKTRITTLPLQLAANRTLTLSHTYIKLMIPVAEYTEAYADVPVKSDTASSGLIIKTYPDLVRIYYLVALQDYKKVKSSDFVAGVNADEVRRQTADKIRVNVLKMPPFVKFIRMVPSKVEYIIVK